MQIRQSRSRVGIVVGVPRQTSGEYWYRTQFLDGEVEVVPESSLDPFVKGVTVEALLANLAFGDRSDLLRTTTFRKLDQPLDNTLYSLQASRTKFYEHQYKPLIRFLDSRNHRLLIADEVGLGKTIEAGIILIEQRARRALESVLIVCPRALCQKWREEMWRRFDEEFRIVGASEFREFFDRLQEQGGLDELRAIVSLQSFRQRANLDLLEATPLPLGMLIFDEAHHLRNPATLGHRTAAAACEGADAVLLLTATPIHLGSENLFHLLRLLDPVEFEDFCTFEMRLRANEPVIEAERLSRSRFPPVLDEIKRRLDGLLRDGHHSRFFADNPIYRRLLTGVEIQGGVSKERVAEIQRDLKDLNLFSHTLNRTRKREVIEESPVRSARVVRPEITAEELGFYRAVTDFVRSLRGGGGYTSFFVAATAQRQVSSSMQAAKGRFVQRALENLLDPEESDLGEDILPESLEGDHAEFSPPQRVIEAVRHLGDTDSKFDVLVETLEQLGKEEPDAKILVFAFFKDTLSYLKRRLTDAGCPCELIHGDVPTDPRRPDRDERAKRIERFRDDPRIRVLLSSEVGGEGLDFQFCRILINYDLPWNPMVVEQRIGRLDRIGQQSDKITIINLSLPHTIDDRILQRLHNRIGIFERSIGDLETIIGDEVRNLTHDLLSRHLTPEEEEERIDETAQIIERRRVELERLEGESSRFVGRDLFFEEQLRRAREGGELLGGEDIRAFLERFLAQSYPKSRLQPTGSKDLLQLIVDSELEAALRSTVAKGAPKYRFLVRLGQGNGRLAVAFDADVAVNDERVEFLAAHHPLIQLAVEHYREHTEELHPVSALCLSASAENPPGTFLYALYQVDIEGGVSRRRVEPLFVSLESGDAPSEEVSSRLFGRLLRESDRWDAAVRSITQPPIEVLGTAETLFLERWTEKKRKIEERNEATIQTQLVSLASTFNARREQKQRLLDQAKERGRQERYIRMLEGTIRNMTAEYESRRAELESEKVIDFRVKLVGCGVLLIE